MFASLAKKHHCCLSNQQFRSACSVLRVFVVVVVVVVVFLFLFLRCCWVGVVASPEVCNLYIPVSTPEGGICCVNVFFLLCFSLLPFFFFFQTER